MARGAMGRIGVTIVLLAAACTDGAVAPGLATDDGAVADGALSDGLDGEEPAPTDVLGDGGATPGDGATPGVDAEGDLGADAARDASEIDRGPGCASLLPAPAACPVCPTPALVSSRPGVPDNVLLVVLDDVGLDYLSLYGLEGAHEPPTPTLAELARDGVLFTTAYSNPDCSPTRTTLATGRHARRSGVTHPIEVTLDPTELRDEEFTLPEVLRDGPFAFYSALIGKWHLTSYLAEGWQTHAQRAGFDWWEGPLANLYFRADGTDEGYFHYEELRNGELVAVDRYATTEQSDDAIARLAVMPEPWFLWLAYSAAHAPLHRPPARLHSVDFSVDAGDVPRHMAMIEAVDAELGRVLAALDPELRARTNVIVVSDNGTPGELITPPFRPERAKGTVFDGGVHVPLIIAGPAVAQPGRTSSALTHTVDLFATIAELGGVDPTCLCNEGRDWPVDGISLVPELQATDDAPAPRLREYVYAERVEPNGWPTNGARLESDRQMIRDDTWKLQRGGGRNTYFFDLRTSAIDEGENLLAAGPLDSEQQAAFERLSAELDRITLALTCSQAAELGAE
jgi:arylsulfatase A-like enzyme